MTIINNQMNCEKNNILLNPIIHNNIFLDNSIFQKKKQVIKQLKLQYKPQNFNTDEIDIESELPSVNNLYILNNQNSNHDIDTVINLEDNMCLLCCNYYVDNNYKVCYNCEYKMCNNCFTKYIAEYKNKNCPHCRVIFRKNDISSVNLNDINESSEMNRNNISLPLRPINFFFYPILIVVCWLIGLTITQNSKLFMILPNIVIGFIIFLVIYNYCICFLNEND